MAETEPIGGSFEADFSARRTLHYRFFTEAGKNLGPAQLAQVQAVYQYAVNTSSYEIKLGTGEKVGSINLSLPAVSGRSLISIDTDGYLSLNFGWLTGSAAIEAKRDARLQAAVGQLGLTVTQKARTRYPSFRIAVWGPRAEQLISVLKDLAR